MDNVIVAIEINRADERQGDSRRFDVRKTPTASALSLTETDFGKPVFAASQFLLYDDLSDAATRVANMDR